MKVVDIMEGLNNLENNSILVIPNNLKEKVLSYINNYDGLLNIKIMTLEEVKRNIYFDYTDEAILYIMDKYKVKSNIAKIYLDNIYYIFDDSVDTKKALFLEDLKNELLDKKLLLINDFFSLFFNRKFVVYGFSYINKFYMKMLKKIPRLEILSGKKINKRNLDVFEFNNINEEVTFVFKEICSLLDSGISLNSIKVAGIDDNYEKELKKLSHFYNVPINFNNKCSIYSTKIVKVFLEFLENNFSFEEAIEYVQGQFDITNDENNYIIKKLIDVCNKYVGFNYDKTLIMELLKDDLKKVHTKGIRYDKAIELVSLDDSNFDEDYVFVLGLNEGKLPKIYKDEDYFSDDELVLLGFDTSIDKNIVSKETLVKTFFDIEKLYLSYSLNDKSGELYPSSIISENDINVIKKEVDYDNSYSNIHDQIILAMHLDNLIKYGEVDKNLSYLYSNYSIDYGNYNNAFSGISRNKLLDYVKHLKLSYTSMDQFYRCGFRYYINNILKLDPFEESFSTFIGNLFHYILSICFNNDFDFDREWDSYLSKRDLRVDECFFLVKLKKELIYIINYLKEFNKETGLTDMIFEKRIVVDKSRDINVSFIGIVDKIMHKDTSYGDLISIIDYKTGNPSINLFNSIYGINMQLPVYLYLVVKSGIFHNPKIVGIYLQRILNNKEDDGEKQEALRLCGYSINDETFIERFDPTYENSKYIKGMKKSKNGFYSYTKLLEEDDVDNFVRLVDDRIDNGINDILNAKFDINPKRIGNINEGCSFCRFKDLCFMKEEDIVNLKEYKDLSFLGGDNNA